MGKHGLEKRWERWTADKARSELKALDASGKPIAAFARERGISVQRLSWWRKRLGKSRVPAPELEGLARFVPAVVKAPIGPLFSATAVTVHLPGGAVLEISEVGAVPPEWVAAILSGMQSSSR